MTGTKISAGTTGWTREKKSRKRDLKRGGEALSRAVRSVDIPTIVGKSLAGRAIFARFAETPLGSIYAVCVMRPHGRAEGMQ
jgi:hypothetical protein